ncbi:hypothetical protein Q3G72_009543 [Acer saccharum]|nr:hypothetical protein Q3G72_009543 [Acer saccharum]
MSTFGEYDRGASAVAKVHPIAGRKGAMDSQHQSPWTVANKQPFFRVMQGYQIQLFWSSSLEIIQVMRIAMAMIWPLCARYHPQVAEALTILQGIYLAVNTGNGKSRIFYPARLNA